jgi:tRNA(Met) C34 N-acetyltransferase TmcA
MIGVNVGRTVASRAAIAACRVALERGALIKHARHWRYRRRLFSNRTVQHLITEGFAVQVGNMIVRVTTWPA